MDLICLIINLGIALFLTWFDYFHIAKHQVVGVRTSAAQTFRNTRSNACAVSGRSDIHQTLFNIHRWLLS